MIKDFNKTAIITSKKEISYRSMLQHIDLFAKYTHEGKGSKTIIFAENREGWIYAFFSVWKNGGIAIPVDVSSKVQDLAYILKDSGSKCIWCTNASMDVAREAIAMTGMEVTLLNIDDHENTDIPEHGPDAQEPSVWQRDDEETAIIIYTSGTTGSPKGVMLTFINLLANIKAVSEEVCIFNDERRTLILLPLHHVLPLQGCMIAPLMCGGGVAISPGMSGPEIMDTLCRGKVAIFVGVPRLWQTFYGGIMKQVNAHAITRVLFRLCEKAQSPTLSRLIFSSLHKKMGGNMRFCVSGGAALDAEIGQGLRTLGIDILDGYGMTETAPMITFTRPGKYIPGSVGQPLPSVECKIVASEMGTTENGKVVIGELCAKGPNVMKGYYNRPEETAAVIDKDGFLHTGDLARIDEEGRIFITGRCKEIIVLSNGKNVQPAEIEAQLERYTERVNEAAVTQKGDMLCAIVVPEQKWAKNLSDEEVESILKKEVLEPYNLGVPQYKKVMSLCIFRGELPRTKLEKLQRFKLKDILEGNMKASAPNEEAPVTEPDSDEYRILRKFIEDEKKVKVKPSDHLETDLAMDSLDRISLQTFIENSFGMQVKADELTSFVNVGELARHIQENKTRMEVEEIDWKKLLSGSDAKETDNVKNNGCEKAEIPAHRTSPLMPVWTKLMKGLIKMYNGLDISGQENIPTSGPFIIAPNHQSFIDAPVAISGLTRKQIANSYFYATEDHVKGALRRCLAHRNNIIIMERAQLKRSILQMAEVLRQGHNLVIFPEGTRTRNGQVGEFKKTFAILASELDIPILPVRISGAYEAWPRTKKCPSPKRIHVEYLPVITPGTVKDDYDKLAEKVRKAIVEK